MKLQYDHIIGTGGIGSGMFFSLTGNHTLGRNESRLGKLEQNRDFCKLHIILHYISKLLKSGSDRGFKVYPIGKVGNDDTGTELCSMMKVTGMDMRGVSVVPGYATLFSVCFQYPDSCGGNITTENSASSQVTPGDIENFFRGLPEGAGNRGIVLAVPEVPLDARIALLQKGRDRGSLNAAAILSGEAELFGQMNGFALVDLMSLNMDEAKTIAGSDIDPVRKCIDKLTAIRPSMSILITDGSKGCYVYSEGMTEHVPSLKVDVISTAGAGDAFFSGTLAALCMGLKLTKGSDDPFFGGTPLKSAAEFGTLLAALSVTSANTIHLDADAQTLAGFAAAHQATFGEPFQEVFQHIG